MKNPLILKLLNSRKCEVAYSRGNAGDKLINAAVKQFLGDSIVDKSDTLVFVGAGGFCNFYKHNLDLKQRLNDYEKIFIISTTIDITANEVKEFFSSLPSHVTVICREKKSFFDVSCIYFNTLLDHDAAFYFDYSPYKEDGEGTLYAYREDMEATGITIPEGNIDVSKCNDYEKLLSTVAKYKTIKTNRLHVAIAATMLGKEVYLKSNAYFKNKAVYDYSLKKFSNVTFEG